MTRIPGPRAKTSYPTHLAPRKAGQATVSRRSITAPKDSRAPLPTPHNKADNANDQRRTSPTANRTEPPRARPNAAQMEAATVRTHDQRGPRTSFHPGDSPTKRMKRRNGVIIRTTDLTAWRLLKPPRPQRRELGIHHSPLTPKEEGAPKCQPRRPGRTSRQHSPGH